MQSGRSNVIKIWPAMCQLLLLMCLFVS